MGGIRSKYRFRLDLMKGFERVEEQKREVRRVDHRLLVCEGTNRGIDRF